MNACVVLKRFPDVVSALVRIQTQSAYKKDPFHRNSLQTETLYTIADLYDLHLAEVVLPYHTSSALGIPNPHSGYA